MKTKLWRKIIGKLNDVYYETQGVLRNWDDARLSIPIPFIYEDKFYILRSISKNGYFTVDIYYPKNTDTLTNNKKEEDVKIKYTEFPGDIGNYILQNLWH